MADNNLLHITSIKKISLKNSHGQRLKHTYNQKKKDSNVLASWPIKHTSNYSITFNFMYTFCSLIFLFSIQISKLKIVN